MPPADESQNKVGLGFPWLSKLLGFGAMKNVFLANFVVGAALWQSKLESLRCSNTTLTASEGEPLMLFSKFAGGFKTNREGRL